MKNDYTHINEDALIQTCLNGDRQAQKELYNKYAKAMYHSILRMAANRAEAQDLLQESFIKVFKELKNFKNRSSLGAWIKRICVNTTLSQLKKNKQMELVELHDEVYQREEEEAQLAFDIALIHECVKKLPKGGRVILNLYLFEGYRHSEIAEILEITESTSKSQYRRAKNLLRNELNAMRYEQG